MTGIDATRRRGFHSLTCCARWRPTWQACFFFPFMSRNLRTISFRICYFFAIHRSASRWAWSWHDSAGTTQGRVVGECDEELQILVSPVTLRHWNLNVKSLQSWGCPPAICRALDAPGLFDDLGWWIDDLSGQNFTRPKKRFMPWRLQS